jgi:hypothetical protein
MNFAAIPAGESVFVDANVFVYDFGPDPTLAHPAESCWNALSKATCGDTCRRMS